jgi:hypothetical protein
VLIQGLFDGSGGDHHIPRRRRRSHAVDIRRDQEGGQKHVGVGVVRQDDQGGRGRDERDGVVVLLVGGARQRSISGSAEQLDGFVEVLIKAYV